MPSREKAEELTYVDKKGNIMTLKMTSSSCCRPQKKTCREGKDCVYKKGAGLFLSSFLTENFQILGKKVCNKRKSNKRRGSKKIKTCRDLKEYFKKKINKKKSPILSTMEKASTKRNPKCIKMYREASPYRPLQCNKKMCRNKEPIPDKRIYKERTLEFGIVVDKYLFHEMKVEL